MNLENDGENLSAHGAAEKLTGSPIEKKKTKKPLKKKWERPPNRPGNKAGTPPEVTAQIISCFLSGMFQTDIQIAEHVKVSPSTVGRIRSAVYKEFPDLLKFAETALRARVETLIVEMIEETLESLKRISALTKNDGWLCQQTAVELATLYGVKADRVIKILDAIQAAGELKEDSEVIP